MGGSANSCCSKDKKASEGGKGENFNPMDRERKSLFKKKRVNAVEGLSSNSSSRMSGSNKISSNMTR